MLENCIESLIEKTTGIPNDYVGELSRLNIIYQQKGLGAVINEINETRIPTFERKREMMKTNGTRSERYSSEEIDAMYKVTDFNRGNVLKLDATVQSLNYHAMSGSLTDDMFRNLYNECINAVYGKNTANNYLLQKCEIV
ncbi:MAG: hypothetical protein HZB65_04300 [Candidatus Aenigmarchaeota archaeon]|nr:hypothetical protein [Candidatus Aenigmarchaeota archaeon]